MLRDLVVCEEVVGCEREMQLFGSPPLGLLEGLGFRDPPVQVRGLGGDSLGLERVHVRRRRPG